jgi:TonB family protein
MNISFWWELLIRSTALLVAAEMVFRLMHRVRPAVRYRLVLSSLMLLTLLPLLVIALPEIHLSRSNPRSDRKAVVTIVEASSRTVVDPARPGLNWLLLVWMAGAVLSSVPLALGAVSVRRIASTGKRFDDEIVISDKLRVPMTCGIVRPRILLPAEAANWSASRWQAVLLHERAHIRRRDVATQLAAHIIAAMWWFQPLAWAARRKLRTESEFACDAEAIRSGVLASEYASELLAIAKSAGRDLRMPAAAIAMVKWSELEARVRAVLYPRSMLPGPALTCLLGVILGAGAVAASSVTAGPHEKWNAFGGSSLKRAFFPALLASAGLSAATIGGTVHDTSGAPVADAKVTVTNPDTEAKQEAMTGSNGKFSLSGDDAGQYILSIEKPGFTSILREFDVKAESTIERDFTMPNEGGKAVPDSVIAATDQSSEKKIRVRGQLAANNLIRKVQPVYPAGAKEARIQGTVELEAAVSKDGVPVELQVVSSPSDDLSNSALEAVRQWRYRPTLLNGNPVEIVTTVIVNYTLSE